VKPSETNPASQAPVCEDLSAYLIAGRLKGSLDETPRYETDIRTPAQGIEDGVLAERLGFRRAFIAERFDLKEGGALLGGVAARTSRIDVGSGLIAIASRHPLLLAALGATMHAAYGPRLVLGLGRGAPGFGPGGHVSMEAFGDHVTILCRLGQVSGSTTRGPPAGSSNSGSPTATRARARRSGTAVSGCRRPPR
jgi:hypothetical protein